MIEITTQTMNEALYLSVPGLRKARTNKDFRACAFLLRDWFLSICCYSGRELLIDHVGPGVAEQLKDLLAYKGGLWCGGAAKLFAGLLRSIQVPACTYSYGYDEEGLSHVTTVFGIAEMDAGGWKSITFYLLDAFL